MEKRDLDRGEQMIFVVDDDPSVRKSLSTLLDNRGYQNETYATAETLLSTFASCPSRSGCLVLDVHLNGMSGFELANRLLHAGSCLPIIFITGKDGNRERQAAQQLNCVAYLEKPFSSAALFEAIDRALTN